MYPKFQDLVWEECLGRLRLRHFLELLCQHMFLRLLPLQILFCMVSFRNSCCIVPDLEWFVHLIGKDPLSLHGLAEDGS